MKNHGLGFLIEVISDTQKFNFKRAEENKGTIITVKKRNFY